MSKRLPNAAKFVEFGDLIDVFVDDLATVEEFGSVTHLVFARHTRVGNDVMRCGTVRLIIPTELRIAMGRRFMTGAAGEASAAEENTHFY